MPTQITVKAQFGKLSAGLRNFGRAIPGLTNTAMGEAMKPARYEASGRYIGGNSYGVSKRSGQAYIRTGEYGAGTKLSNPAPKVWRITQSAWYSKWVGGGASGDSQAGIHAGRWPLLPDAVMKAVNALKKTLPNAMREFLRKEGIGL